MQSLSGGRRGPASVKRSLRYGLRDQASVHNELRRESIMCVSLHQLSKVLFGLGIEVPEDLIDRVRKGVVRIGRSQ